MAARVRLLVLLAAAPAVLLVVYQARTNRTDAIAAAQDHALWTVRALAISQQELINNTRHFLSRLADLGPLQNLESRDCSRTLADLLSLNPAYVNLGGPRADGALLCNEIPLSAPVNVASRAYFQRAITEREFSVGAFQIDRAAQVASVNFAVPVLRRGGREVLGAAVAVVSLDWWSQRLQKLGLPEGIVARVTDPQGLVLARFPP